MSACGFGIDGGGTRSRIKIFALPGNETLYQGEGGSTNIYGAELKTVLAHLRQLIAQGCERAGVSLRELACGCLGTAGLGRPKERGPFEAFFQSFLQCPVKLCNDGEILLVGSLESTQGYCLIGGTGSLALARNAAGEVLRAGGLGYMISDEGSACWIGWEAVKRALRSVEGRDLPTGMLPDLCAFFGVDQGDAFVPLFHHHFQKAQVAASAALVLQAAEAGDPLALDIAEKAAGELCALLESVVARMPLEAPRAALSGGVIENSAFLRRELMDLLYRRLPELALVTGGGDALEGACILAREMLSGS